jgi:hypothetical protein
MEKKLLHLDLSDHKIKASEALSSLITLNHHLDDIQHNPVSTEEMERMAKLAWSVHSAYSHRIKNLELEKSLLKAQTERMWTLIESTLYPALQIDSSLLTIYKELSDIWTVLNDLKKYPELFVHEAKDATVLMCQDRLHKVEAKKVGGIFVGTSSAIPTGQAILNSLLEKCYHLVWLLNTNESTDEHQTKLDALVTNLISLLSYHQSGIPIEQGVVEVVEKDVKAVEQEIQVQTVDEKITRKVELARELVEELRLEIGRGNECGQVIKKVTEARESLLEIGKMQHTSFEQRDAKVQGALKVVYDAMNMLDQPALTDKDTLVNVIQSTLGIAAGILHQPSQDFIKIEKVIKDIKAMKKSGVKDAQKVTEMKKVVEQVQGKDSAVTVLKDQVRVLIQSLL